MFSKSQIEDATTNKWLHLVLNTTEQCNLRCPYCYEDHVPGAMKKNVQEAVIKLVSRRAMRGLEKLSINLFGGEPLLAWPTVDFLLNGINEIASFYSIEFGVNITTNAVLLDQEKFSFLADRGLSGMLISLDGPKHIHDTIRIKRNGKPTYDRIINALRIIKSSEANKSRRLSISIGIHFSPETIDALYEDRFVEKIVDEFVAGDKNFELSISEIKRFGGPNDKNISIFNFKPKQHHDELVRRALKAGCTEGQIASHRGMCFAAMANSFVVRPDGRLSKCTISLGDDANIVGRISDDGDIILDDRKFYPWVVGLLTGDEGWLQCPKYHVNQMNKTLAAQ